MKRKEKNIFEPSSRVVQISLLGPDQSIKVMIQSLRLAFFFCWLVVKIQSFFSGKHALMTTQRTRTVLGASYQVVFRYGGEEREISVDENESLLSAASEAGITWFDADCRIGNCLRCPSKILAGEIRQDFGEDVKQHGYALSCVAFPLSDCVIECLDEDDKETSVSSLNLLLGSLKVSNSHLPPPTHTPPPPPLLISFRNTTTTLVVCTPVGPRQRKLASCLPAPIMSSL